MEFCFFCLFIIIFGLIETRFDPDGAWPGLASSWSGEEEVDHLGDLTVYRFGPGLNDKWLLWGHDIYGPDSGRTKEYCNKMWTDLGVTCIIPDFFRGESRPQPPPSWHDTLLADWEFKLMPYLMERGARSVGAVGTCYGSYVVMHLSSEGFGGFGLMSGGVSIHPGHPGVMAEYGEDEAEVYSHISSPQYFMATPDTPESLRPGGLAEVTIETTMFDEYEAPCVHGFFNRGNLTDPGVAECVDTAMAHLITFLEDNLVF